MIVGLDVGTSVTKAAAFDADGAAIAVEARPTRLLHGGDGRVEQDVAELLAAAESVLAGVCARVGEPPQAIGVTGQGDGLWLLDEAGAPVRHGLSWMDARAGGIVAEWIADGTFDALYRATGNAPFPGAGAPLLAALQAQEPEALARAATAARCKDVVAQHLAGVRATDLSDASNLFADTAARRRTPELLDLIGLGDHADLLPPVSGEALPQGGLRDELSAALGAPAGLPVTAGPYDLPACAIGAGVTAVGDGLLIAGTTLACEVLVDRVAPAAEPAGQTLCVPGDARWLRAMPAMTGTAALDWALRIAGATHEQLNELLAASPPGAKGVRVLPYLSSSGERAPFVAPDARGRLDGVSLDTTAADVVRAFCESLAFAARHCFEAAGLTGEVAVCGGGSAARAWLQVFADVIGRPLRIARGPEVGARGAALAAAAQLGLAADTATWTRSEQTVEPDPAATDAYAERYARYRADVEAAREGWIRPARAA
jgi:xylulokinase